MKRRAMLLSLFLILALNTNITLAADTISLGQSLSGNQTLVSNGGQFELGFFSPSNSSANRYYIGIWYKTIPTRDVFWVANRETPISDPSSAHLKISQDGRLVLVNGSMMPIWSSSTAGPAADRAVLLDTGNLVLRRGPASDTPVWQSFDHPTDTLMPGGWIGMNKITGEYLRITAWKNSEDPAPGPYVESMDPDGSNQFLLRWNDLQVYWTSGLWNGQVFSFLLGTSDKSVLNFTFIDGKERKHASYTVTYPFMFSRGVVHSSGQLIHWLWLNSSQQSLPLFSAPSAQCNVYRACGSFGVCNQNATAVCRCIEGFEPTSKQEWNKNDWSSGCFRRTPIQCGRNSSTGDGFLRMDSVALPANPHNTAARTAKECEIECLNNCSCLAYSYSGACSIWGGDIMNLRQLDGDDSEAETLYVRLATSDLPHSSRSHKTVNAVAVPCGVLALAICVVLALKWVRKTKRTKISKHSDGSLISFTYADLRRMTKNFSEEMGRGGFGSVFKGTLPDSSAIAVKKLKGVLQVEKQFRSEVSTLGIIQHVNLVRLRGFCCEGSKRLLVYDYMPGGSLDSHLFKESSMALDWRMRYQIMLGVARGLAYLHEACRECIIHCDIKPDNILLDAELHPKVADFGMAKLVSHDFSHVMTTMRGTIGYLAPEWISGLPVTPKVDVYSFGMVLFELISGKRNNQQSKEGSEGFFFPSWAAPRVIGGDVMSLLDRRLNGDADVEELKRACMVACWCIQDSEACRPSMRQVVQILEGVSNVNLPPIPASLWRFMKDEPPRIYSSPSSEDQQKYHTASQG